MEFKKLKVREKNNSFKKKKKKKKKKNLNEQVKNQSLTKD